MPKDLAQLLAEFAAKWDEVQQYMDDAGFESFGDLINAIQAHPNEQPTQVGWPPPFEVSLDRVGEDGAGNTVLSLNLHNIDRDLTAFEVDFTDFDPDNDGTVDVLWMKAGPELESLNWFASFNPDTGRFGAFQSAIREYDDNPSEYESIELMRFGISRDDEVNLHGIGVSGNYDKGDGRGERHFTYHDFADAEYVPEG